MEYICDKIIFITKFEILHIYISKLGLWVEFLLVKFFMVNDIDIHQLNLGPFKFLDEISFK
jgi:hypothetical protein